MKKYLVTFGGVGLLGVLAVAIFMVATGFSGSRRETLASIAESTFTMIESPFTHKPARLSLHIFSPDRKAVLLGRDCQQLDSPHEFPFCDVRLEQIGQDGKRHTSDWVIPKVGYGDWSANSAVFAVIDNDHRIWVGDFSHPPTMLSGHFSGPALSPSGKQLAAQRLGDGENLFDQIASSDGMVVFDLVTGKDKIVLASNDVYAPFFIDETRLEYESGGTDYLSSMYMVDLKSGVVTRLTNRKSDPSADYPSPSAGMLTIENGNKIVFNSRTGEFTEQVFELSLIDFSFKPRPDLTAPSFRDHEVVREDQ